LTSILTPTVAALEVGSDRAIVSSVNSGRLRRNRDAGNSFRVPLKHCVDFG